MDIIVVFAYFILGVVVGATGVISLALIYAKRSLDKRKEETKSPGTKMESVGSRMKKVKDITTEQLDLQSQVVGPQKNALHGRYKNDLNGRIKELELQKADILRSIIADGFDPEITVVDGAGVVTTIKLSEFLAQTGVVVPPKNSQPTKQVNKFTVHKGGKDDGGNTTH